MAKIIIKSRSRGVKGTELQVDALEKFSIGELRKQIRQKSKLHQDRQRLTTEDKKVLEDDEKTLGEFGLKDGDTVLLKDLGPQISWRTVFVVEYLGPLLVHPFFFFAQTLIYGGTFNHTRMQQLAFGLVILHYLKRELETLFVHRFSHGTMPAFNIFKNSAHYWFLGGALIAYPLYAPFSGYQVPIPFTSHSISIKPSIHSLSFQQHQEVLYPIVAVWIFSEVSNLISHVTLASLRPKGEKKTKRAIPRTYGFELVSCPNYLFESLAWAAFLVLTGNWASAIFLFVSFAQMLDWALKKHRNYRKEFPDYPKERKAMIPFVI